MKAITYQQFGGADQLRWKGGWPEPDICAESVLLRTIAGGVNPKDILLRKGKFSKTLARESLPRISGMEAAGEIVAVGKSVDGFYVGDQVFGMSNHFAGGVHSEFSKFHMTEIFHAPRNISMAEASCVPLAAQTALQALRDCCRLQNGQKVLINGASGGVGHFAVQIAKIMGAEVHAVCGPEKADFVRSLGADVIHDYTLSPATEIDFLFDVVFDVFGKYSRSFFAGQLGKKGVYVSTVPKLSTIWGEMLAWCGIVKNSRLVRVVSRSHDLERLKGWIEQGRLVPHLDMIYPAERAAEAHRHIESLHTKGKICITFSHFKPK